MVVLLLGNVEALGLDHVGLDRALEGRRGAVMGMNVEVAHANNLGANFDDYFFQEFIECAITVLVDEFIKLTGHDGVFDFADIAVPGAFDFDEQVEGNLDGAVAHVAADPVQLAVAVALLQGLEGDVLDQAPVDDDLVADCGAIIDIGSGESQAVHKRNVTL